MTLLLMCLTVTTAWAWDGSGTFNDPYQIKTTGDLNQLASDVNGGTGYEGTYFKLMNDINFNPSTPWYDFANNENNFTPIGGFQKFFGGNFDGNGKTISGIRISLNNNDHGNILRGLFGNITQTANIHDLTLADTRITGYNTVGGIVGISEGVINNCHVANNVAIRSVYNSTLNTYSFGGIAGSNAGTITSCTSAVQISISGTNGTYYGAIAGDNTSQGSLTNNFANGATIPAASDSTYGAIAGYNYDGTLTRNLYTNCTVAGTPNATGVGCNNSDETEDGGALPSTLLSGSTATEMTVLPGGWYIVTGNNITYSGELNFTGDINLVLADGAHLTINCGSDFALNANGHTLTIYGQTNGTGALTANATGSGIQAAAAIHAGNIIVNGGNITAHSTGDRGIAAIVGDVTINGGTVNATGGTYGIYAHNTITLAGGKVNANSYSTTARVKDGLFYFDNNGTYYSGTLSDADKTAIAGTTISPIHIDLALANNADNSSLLIDNNGKTRIAALKDRTLYKDGAWNTLCLPFDVEDGNHDDQVTFSGTPLEGATVMTLSTSSFDQSNGTLTLNFAASDHIGAGVPYIIKWDKPEGYDAHPENFDIHNPVFSGVTVSNTVHDVETSEVFFLGCFSPVEIGMEDRTKLYLTAGNNLCFPGAAMTIGSCRAYFQLLNGLIAADLAGSGNAPGRIVLNFGEDHTATTVQSVDQTDKGHKFLRNNQLYILREGVLYDALGRRY